MTTHTPHGEIYMHGLDDTCPRCQELAAHPVETLDRENLERLLNWQTHTQSDEAAAHKLRDTMTQGLYLDKLRRGEES